MTPETEMVYRDIVLPYELLPWQRRVKADPHRFKVIVAGGRSGKTTAAVDWITTEAPQDDMSLGDSVSYYVAPTYTQAEDIAWGKLKLNLRPLQAQGLVKRIYEGDMSVELAGGQWLQLKGGDKPDSLRGVKLRRVVLDEFAVMKYEVWEEVLEPRTADYLAPVWFIGTPKGMNHFQTLALRDGKRGDDGQLLHPDWKTFYVKTSEAGTIRQEELDRARRDMDPRVFRQEFEASFESFGGRVYADFDPTIHVTKDAVPFNPALEYVVGLDFGWSSPMPALLMNIDSQDNVYVFAEIVRRETPIPEFAKLICNATPGHKPSLIGCDPAGAAKSEAMGLDSVSELRAVFGHQAVRYGANYPGVIQDGINQIRKWIRNGKFKVSPACPHLIQAFLNYRYPDPKDQVQSEIPLKDGKADHPCFVAGTMIATEGGDRPIESIRAGDRVWTRAGLRKVAHAAKTGDEADILMARFSDGTTLAATPNHPFWVEGKGFISLDTMRYGDIMDVCQKQSFTRESPSVAIPRQGGTQTVLISGRTGVPSSGLATFIERFGRTLMARFRRALISITSTATLPIIFSGTWNCETGQSIGPIPFAIGQATWNTSPASGPSPLNGTDPKRDANGIVSMASAHSRSGFRWLRCATNAANDSRQHGGARLTASALTTASRNGAGKADLITRHEPVSIAPPRSSSTSTPANDSAPASVVRFIGARPAGKSPVYNLSVADIHEYYANGILVSNCDGVRYLFRIRFPMRISKVEAM